MADNAPLYKGFRVYPRGFLGASLGEQIKQAERPFAGSLKTHTYHPDWFKPAQAPREVNRNIENMWRKAQEHRFVFDDINFREELLKIALQAFGTMSFQEWVSINQQGPSTGDMHMEFIQDTLQFIQTGKRSMNLHSWTMMLSLSEVTHNDTPNEGQFKWFFVNENAFGPQRCRNQSVVDVIQRWCSQEGGFIDMAQTLHVLFGEIGTY